MIRHKGDIVKISHKWPRQNGVLATKDTLGYKCATFLWISQDIEIQIVI